MYYLLSVVSYFLSILPESLIISISKAISYILFHVIGFRKKLVISNITQAFGDEKSEKEILDIAKRSYYEFILTCFETMISFNLNSKHSVNIINKKIVDEIMAEGNGCYVLVSHLGNWEFAASAFSKEVAPVRVVVKKVGGKGTDRFVTELRARNGFEVIHKKPAGVAVRTIFKTINEGKCVGVMLDQHKPGRKVC